MTKLQEDEKRPALHVTEDCPVRGAKLIAVKRTIKRLYQCSRQSDVNSQTLMRLLKEAHIAMLALIDTYVEVDAAVAKGADSVLQKFNT